MKKQTAGGIGWIVVALAVAWTAPRAWAGLAIATNNGDWYAPAVWSNAALPVAGDDVIIRSGKSVKLTRSPPALASVSNYGTLTFTNWHTTVTATHFTVSAGTITHGACSASGTTPLTSNRVSIVCSNLTIASGASVGVNGVGYYPAGPGNSSQNRRGGSYGGKGADIWSGPTYGSSNAPTDPGSTGGGQSSGTGGGKGGGAVRIAASGTVTVNGTLSADGLQGGADAGGGSGGSLYVTCARLAGSGTIQAIGGPSGNNGVNAGGGGGGRIALYYSQADTFSGTPSAAGGIHSPVNPGGSYAGKTGTVVRLYTGSNPLLMVAGSPANRDAPAPYAHGSTAVAPGTTVTNNVTSPADQAAGRRYACVGWAARTNGVLIGSGGSTQAVFTMPAVNTRLTFYWTNVYQLTTTAGPGGTVGAASGWYTNGASVSITQSANSGYYFSQWTGDVPTNAYRNASLAVVMDRLRAVRANFGSTTPSTKTWTGTGNWTNNGNWSPAGMPGYLDAVVISSGSATLSQPTWVRNATVRSGATLTFTNWMTILNAADVTVTGTVTHVACAAPVQTPVASNRVYIVCSNLTVASGGLIDANWCGYYPGGPGNLGLAYNRSGASYGGKGTDSWLNPNNLTYGSSNAPVDPGTTGGGQATGLSGGSRGGGAIRISAAGTVTVNGAVRANSVSEGGDRGGGSGGSIYITCGTLAGSGSVEAKGADSGNNGVNAGGGGGGRIALYYSVSDDLAGLVTAAGGKHNAGNPGGPYAGQTGTVVRLFNGTAALLTVVGSPANRDTPTPRGYGSGAVSLGTVLTNSVTSPADVAAGYSYLCTGWDVKTSGVVIASGVTTQAVFTMPGTAATLTYYWGSAYELTVTEGAGGNAADVGGWYTNGAVVNIAQTPDGGYYFSQWTGDVPTSAHRNASLAVVMDRPRAVRANYGSTTPSTKTWTGTGLWTSGTNWSPAGMPGYLDTAVIQAGTATVADPVWVDDVAVNSGATLGFTNWSAALHAADVTCGGTVSHASCYAQFAVATISNRVAIVCSNLTVAAGGAINVDEKGYFPGGPGNAGMNSRGGGGYGGRGGAGYGGAGPTYGSASAPTAPGSSGGSQSTPYGGGRGGGAAFVQVAGALTVDGLITANGGTGGADSGGGSGGGLYLTCHTIRGNGTIRANGGLPANTVNGAGGGGGRIALYYNAASQAAVTPKPNLTLSAANGLPRQVPAHSGEIGTVYPSDAQILPEAMTTNFNGVIYNVATWAPASLICSGLVTFATPAEIAATSNVLLALPASYAYRPPMLLNRLTAGGSVRLDGAHLWLTNTPTLVSGLDLALTNSSTLSVFGGATNVIGPDYGALVDVAGTLSLATTCWIYPYSQPTNGGSALFRLANLTVMANAGFNADAKGYLYPGTPGAAGQRGGGGYGGNGGGGIGGNQGLSYGVSNAPVQPGSSGGSDSYTNPSYRQRGGGLIRIDASRTVRMDGLLTADGQYVGGDRGGGAGGGIYIRCRTFAGSGVIRARGANAGTTVNSGGGGGGRIAVLRLNHQWTGDLSWPTSVTNGLYGSPAAQIGTLFWGEMKVPRGTTISIR